MNLSLQSLRGMSLSALNAETIAVAFENASALMLLAREIERKHVLLVAHVVSFHFSRALRGMDFCFSAFFSFKIEHSPKVGRWRSALAIWKTFLNKRCALESTEVGTGHRLKM